MLDHILYFASSKGQIDSEFKFNHNLGRQYVSIHLSFGSTRILTCTSCMCCVLLASRKKKNYASFYQKLGVDFMDDFSLDVIA